MSPEKEKKEKHVYPCICVFIYPEIKKKRVRSQAHSANSKAYHLGSL